MKQPYLTNKACMVGFFLFAGVAIFSLWDLNRLGSVTTDELLQYERTMWQLKAAANLLRGKEAVATFDPYGIIQKIPATLYAFVLWLSTDSTRQPAVFPIGEYFRASHLSSLLTGFGCCWILFRVSRLSRLPNPWLAPLLLAASPVFMGHSLFNIKDIPFAFFYTLFTASWASFVVSPVRRARLTLIFMAITVGLLASLKMTVYPLLLLTAAFGILLRHRATSVNSDASYGAIILQLISVLSLSLVVATIALPGSWSNPLPYLHSAFTEFQDYPWDSCNNFAGQCTGKYSGASGWTTLSYLADWLPSKLTLPNLFFSILSFFCMALSLSGATKTKFLTFRDASRIGFGLQFLLIPLMAILANSNIYNEIRHLLFILPAISQLGSDAIQDIYTASSTNHSWKLLSGATLAALLLCNLIDTAALAPYQYTYFNEATRSHHLSGGTDLDYWGASLGELYEHSKSRTKLFADLSNGREKASITNFRLAQRITSPISEGPLISRIDFRKTPKDAPKPPGCKKNASVTRRYPLTNQRFELSALFLCPKS